MIGGSCAEVYEAALRADFRRAFSESTAARLLVGARTTAERLVAAVRPGVSAPTEDSGEAMTLAGLEGHGQYVLLGVDRPHEIVFGMIGRFWGGETRWEQIDASEFGSFDHPGLCRIACNFSLRPYGEARTLVSYETRTHATDAASRRAFRRYWRVASPPRGSGPARSARSSGTRGRHSNGGPSAVLIQTHFPTFATDTKQSTIVDATADATFHAIRHADFSRSGLVLVLAALRELPDRAVRAVRR